MYVLPAAGGGVLVAGIRERAVRDGWVGIIGAWWGYLRGYLRGYCRRSTSRVYATICGKKPISGV